ncbi:nucleotide disphospho-sugar-binding domain-containing protein [Streptomyces sp. 796.1]|uniref:nucleotide disphospho-sugar-binding domain-containing protein n=1 Tax=Streptomyces sp. 796.1 TaxID=3163029 RepID=UPI0039C9AA30
MKILITAAGSYGDVVPYLAVGARLSAAGHEVALATHAPYASAAAEHGLGFHPLAADPRRTGAPASNPPGRALSDTSDHGPGDAPGHPLDPAEGATPRKAETTDRADGTDGTSTASTAGKAGKAELLRVAADFVRQLAPGLVDAARPGADLLLFSTSTAPLGWHVAEALGAPSMGLYLQPVAPTGDFPPAVGPTRSLGRWGNRAAGRLALRVVDRIHADAVRELRRGLALPAATARAVRREREAAGWPVLYGFSPALVPRPADWRPGQDVVGTWWPPLPADAALPARLADFLQAGPPPVFVGFGSMGGGAGERLSEVALRALRAAGVRGVVQAGWAGLAAHGDDVLTIGEVPHALLFPRMAAVVHHAGAGTTAAAARAGVPSVPVPVLADQPFWAARLAAHGAATPPLPFADLTADRLAAAITRALTDPGLATGAGRLAAAMAAEDGTGAVVRAVAALATGRRTVQ